MGTMHGKMTAQEAADYLGMTLEAVYKCIQRGTLQATKWGRKMYVLERGEVESYKCAKERLSRRAV